jgi:hypothetical protein
MHITVRLDEATLTQLLAELLPITVVLDATGGSLGDRWVTIDPVRHLELRSGDGIRLLTSGALRWTVGFVPVTVTIARLVVMLRPLVVGLGTASRLVFRPVIEEADLRHVPAMLDRQVVGLVNRALEQRSKRLAWDVGRTLALRFILPDTLVPLEGAAVGVEAAHLRVEHDALELTVTLAMHISRLAGARAA